MTYNSNIHHRRSIRLKGYDYSQEGLYYITICVQDRVCLFGNVVGAPHLGAQHNKDTQKNDNAPDDDWRMDDNGRQIGQPRGIAPTHATTDGTTHAPIMILNDSGKMVETEWLKLIERFPNIELHEYMIIFRIKPFQITSLTIRPNGRGIDFSINDIINHNDLLPKYTSTP